MVRCGASGPLDGADAAPSSSPPLSWLSSTRLASAVAESWKGETLARVRGDIVRLERPCLDPTPTTSTRGPPPPRPRVGPTSCAQWPGCLCGAASAGLPTIVGRGWIWSQMPTSMRGRKGMGDDNDQALRLRRDSRGLLARSWSPGTANFTATFVRPRSLTVPKRHGPVNKRCKLTFQSIRRAGAWSWSGSESGAAERRMRSR
jgi:hypothetical protein